MLIYAKDGPTLGATDVRWREARAGVDEILEAGRRAWEQAEGATPIERAASAETALKAWQRGLPRDHPARSKGLSDNNKIDEQGRVYRKDNISWPGGGGPRYDVLHPETGMPVKVPGSGWRYSEERMRELIADGRVLFGPNHSHYINKKSFLAESDSMGPESVFNRKRTGAATHLQRVLGDKRFPNPKDHDVLMRWIRVAAPDDAVILDFFGGSGTTTEAVLRLNAEDGGTRQSILVTNNEVGAKQARVLRKSGHHPGDPEWESLGVFEYVTRPRISTVVTGTRPDGSIYSDGLAANVEMFDLTYLDPGMVRRGREFASIAPLLWLEAGGVDEPVIEVPESGWALTSTYGILFATDALAPFGSAVSEAARNEVPPSVVFVVTDSPTEYQHAVERLPVGIESVRLYEDYLSSYTINVEGGAR
jgi:adenine-specific DNA-methyltransferase